MSWAVNPNRSTLAIFVVGLPMVLMSWAGYAAEPVKLGLVLPYSAVYASLGNDITNGLELALSEVNYQVAGRPIEVLKQDSQVSPKVGLQITKKFIQQDKVDFLVGPVASHVANAMRKAAHDSKTFMIIANAGSVVLTRELCSPYIFRTSFSNWQPNYPMGIWMAREEGIKRVAILAPNYAAGRQMMEAFKEGFRNPSVVLHTTFFLNSSGFKSGFHPSTRSDVFENPEDANNVLLLFYLLLAFSHHA